MDRVAIGEEREIRRERRGISSHYQEEEEKKMISSSLSFLIILSQRTSSLPLSRGKIVSPLSLLQPPQTP